MAKITCVKCGKEKREREFYLSRSEIYSNTRRLPICRDCLSDRYLQVLEHVEDYILALKYCCFNFDIYFNEDLALSLDKDEQLANRYIDKLNSNTKAKDKDKTSLDNDILNSVSGSSSNSKIELMSKWGEGYTDNEYLILENKEKEYFDHYTYKTLTERKLYKEVCQLEVDVDKARKEGDTRAYRDLSKLLSDKREELNINPNQVRNDDENSKKRWGKWIDIIENYRPIGEPLDIFKDVDRIRKYINEWFISQMRRMFDFDSDKSKDEEDGS